MQDAATEIKPQLLENVFHEASETLVLCQLPAISMFIPVLPFFNKHIRLLLPLPCLS
jgi:hypothetical protein